MKRDDLLGYFETWSAVQRFIAKNGFNPVDALKEKIKPLWKEEKQEVVWKITLKAGRNE
ncbi:MAG TPA: hypothetical protein VD905_05455 [Flavobacteriales bacterium]|nr:hypothetical protein [Flavobacteriales bacterium]